MLTVRHAFPEEKYKTYEWLCLSNTTHMHSGEPDYPQHPVPDLEQFNQDFEDFYYTEEGRSRGSVMIIENDGEEIGCLCYACFHLKENRAELDVWMKDLKYCGKGYGPQALKLLIHYLNSAMGVNKFLIRPSEKNINAVKAYEKAGFAINADKMNTIEEYLLPEYFELYGPGDYGLNDTAVLTMELSMPRRIRQPVHNSFIKGS